MRTTLLLAVICVGVGSASLRGQTVIVTGAVGCAPAGVPVCQVSAAPVVVAAPVVYRAPVGGYYASPNVIYVGAGSGYPRPNYYSGCGYGPGSWGWGWGYPLPNVIPFGAGQAYAHGYYFRHCR